METESSPSRSSQRPRFRRAIFLLRRLHLFLGLVLFPWVVLYGVTGYLFNHPSHFADQPTYRFSKSAFEGTAIADFPTADSIATEVVELLNLRFQPSPPYLLDPSVKPRFSDEYLFGRVDRKGDVVQFLIHTEGTGGTFRVQPAKPIEPTAAPAPFVVSPGPLVSTPVVPSGDLQAKSTQTEPLRMEDDLAQKIVESMPKVLERMGLAGGEQRAVVTSIPEVLFAMRGLDRDGVEQVWTVRYHLLRGSVSASPGQSSKPAPLSWRQYLLRLHTAHIYPDRVNARWCWAVIVDAMALVLLSWVATGLVMWWHIKSTRLWGLAAITIGVLTAIASAWAMILQM